MAERLKMIKSYQKGCRLERKIVNEARSRNLVSGRTAGSHTIFDVFIIDFKNKKIEFIQAKAKKVYGKEKKELEKLKDLSGKYTVEFKVWSK